MNVYTYTAPFLLILNFFYIYNNLANGKDT